MARDTGGVDALKTVAVVHPVIIPAATRLPAGSSSASARSRITSVAGRADGRREREGASRASGRFLCFARNRETSRHAYRVGPQPHGWASQPCPSPRRGPCDRGSRHHVECSRHAPRDGKSLTRRVRPTVSKGSAHGGKCSRHAPRDGKSLTRRVRPTVSKGSAHGGKCSRHAPRDGKSLTRRVRPTVSKGSAHGGKCSRHAPRDGKSLTRRVRPTLPVSGACDVVAAQTSEGDPQ